MDRKEFLKITGVSAGAFLLANCLSSCKKNNTASPNVDFTLDLTQSANSALNNAGGFIYKDGVIVAKAVSGNFIAVASACTHQGTSVVYQSSSDRFHCPNHGSDFTDDGSVINGPASSPLKKYNTSLSGNMLRVFS